MLPINRIKRARRNLEEHGDRLGIPILVGQAIERDRVLLRSRLGRGALPGKFAKPDHGRTYVGKTSCTNCFDAIAAAAQLVDRVRGHAAFPDE